MKKHLAIFSACLFTALFCAGCGAAASSQPAEPSAPSAAPSSQAAEPEIAYSNLADAASQKEVTDLLEYHGVAKEQTDTLISWATDFNSRVTSGTLPEGFVPMTGTGVDYSGLIIQNKEADDGSFYPEANCRLTSYLLMKNFIETNGAHADDDTFLIFDVEAIDEYEPLALSPEERSEFISLFSWVPVDGADTLEAHIERIQNAWKERDVQIGGEGISLITVYLHSPFDQVRFVGHTGVLLQTDAGLLFVEKYGPQLPFQATKFQNREELKQYLLSRADLYGDETELAPIVMENDRLI